MIGILDIKMGNLKSVFNALYYLGYDPLIVDSPKQLEQLTHLIVPGVGAFPTAMAHMRSQGLVETIRRFAEEGRPLMGLCLGMQLLADRGEEHKPTEGLGLIPGEVVRIDVPAGYRLPHVGWNTVDFHREHPVFKGVKNGIDCYFVHSYHFVCSSDYVLATTDYSAELNCIVGCSNVLGLQMHPEKSQGNGLRILENFCNWDGTC